MKYGDELLCDPRELAGLDPAKTAHICIDVQNFYFRNKGREAEDIAGRIALIAPAFNRAGLAKEVYVYHMQDTNEPDFFIVQPKEGDILAKKYHSAFEETNLHARLKGAGIENLILSGGYAFDCVSATARDALERDYNVVILENCIYDPCDPDDALMLKNAFQHHSRYGERKEALFARTADVLKRFREEKRQPVKPPTAP